MRFWVSGLIPFGEEIKAVDEEEAEEIFRQDILMNQGLPRIMCVSRESWVRAESF